MEHEPIGTEYLIEYGNSGIILTIPQIKEETKLELEKINEKYVKNEITYLEGTSKYNLLIGQIKPIEMIKLVLDCIKNPPLPPIFDYSINPLNKKQRHWTSEEDIRLMAGVYLYGVNNWNSVSNFVGAGRGRPQCLQRWTRTLNPQILKNIWNPEEDEKLLSIVKNMSKISWTKVASLLGNRSDVQCRYHYSQLIRKINEKKENSFKKPNILKQIPLPFKPLSLIFAGEIEDSPMNVDQFLSRFTRY